MNKIIKCKFFILVKENKLASKLMEEITEYDINLDSNLRRNPLDPERNGRTIVTGDHRKEFYVINL